MQRLRRIVASAPDLDRRDITQRDADRDLQPGERPPLGFASRVIDVGSGTGALIPHLQVRPPTPHTRVLLPALFVSGKQGRAPGM